MRGGRQYYLLDMIKEDEVGVDTQDYTDTITVDSDTNDLSVILKQLDAHREVTTEDGHTGLLALDYTSVKVEAKGYKTNTRSLSATRTYPNLSDADLELIPKTITDGGKTLTLGAVEWSGGENGFYTATYTGTSSTRSATGYTVTASYTGQVAKTGCEAMGNMVDHYYVPKRVIENQILTCQNIAIPSGAELLIAYWKAG